MPYFSNAYILGIRPRQPGFKEFLVKPYPAHLTHARGGVPTPVGEIIISWELREGGLSLEVSYPQGLVPILDSYPEYPIIQSHLTPRV